MNQETRCSSGSISLCLCRRTCVCCVCLTQLSMTGKKIDICKHRCIPQRIQKNKKMMERRNSIAVPYVLIYACVHGAHNEPAVKSFGLCVVYACYAGKVAVATKRNKMKKTTRMWRSCGGGRSFFFDAGSATKMPTE